MFSGTVAFVDSVIFDHLAFVNTIMHRSEERRVGKECSW